MTTAPENVATEMKNLIKEYESKNDRTLEDLLDFHVAFERIHPFQDGNGRVGRLVLFKECLRNGILPFILKDENKSSYYRGLKEYFKDKGCLLDTC